MSAIIVDIGRIILTDLDVTADRAERIQAMVEVELQRLLEREGLPDGLTGSDVSYLSAPMLHLPESQSDSYLANRLAQRIAQALRGV